MTDALYHEALLALARAAHGAGALPSPTASAAGDNPLCGDRVALDVRFEGPTLRALAHRVQGCLLCRASASLLATLAPERTAAELREARKSAANLLRHGAPPEPPWDALAVFQPVAAVPSRHACVLLPFDVLLEAAGAGAAPAAAIAR